jgi:PLP dependent protein
VDISANLKDVRERIQRACARSGREPESVTLVAVSKGHPAETVAAAAAAGLTVFGESRVQEARVKIGQCPGRLEWHLIGHLQSNKCRDAVHFFGLIQSVDSLELAREINQWAEKAGRTARVLLEINVAGESSKFGYAPEKALQELGEINALPRIEIHGLMTVAPWAREAEKVRPVFRRLREIKGQCEDRLGASLAHLSMGMSGDFEVAVEEGATMIRLGGALFGARPAGKPAGAD